MRLNSILKKRKLVKVVYPDKTNNMKKSILILSAVVFTAIVTTSFRTSTSNESPVTFIDNTSAISSEKVSIKLKGTGSKQVTVKVGVGTAVGKCERGCYKTIGPNTTVQIQANAGDVIWDADRKTTILKVSSGMDGDVIDLKNYY
jgi:hypothetical protein